MTSQLIPFQFETSAIRVVVINDQPMFGARDVALALGYANPAEAYKDHCKSLKLFSYSELLELKWVNPNPRGEYVMPEPDVYRLIVKSEKPEAERFEKWVFEEVLPSIRKTGSYTTRPVLTRLEILESALETEKAHLATMAKLEQTQQENAALRILTDQELGYSSILRAAKCIGVHESTFNWRPLKAMSKHLGLPVKRAPSSRYSYQLLYPIKAFEECYPNYDFTALTPEFLIDQVTTKYLKAA